MVKKSVGKRKNASKKVSPKKLPIVKKISSKQCARDNNSVLCGLSMIAFVFFLMTMFDSIVFMVLKAGWLVWLLAAILLGYKPMVERCSSRK